MDKYLVVWYYTTEESKKWTIRHTLKHTQNKEDKNYYLEIPFRQFKIALIPIRLVSVTPIFSFREKLGIWKSKGKLYFASKPSTT